MKLSTYIWIEDWVYKNLVKQGGLLALYSYLDLMKYCLIGRFDCDILHHHHTWFNQTYDYFFSNATDRQSSVTAERNLIKFYESLNEEEQNALNKVPVTLNVLVSNSVIEMQTLCFKDILENKSMPEFIKCLWILAFLVQFTIHDRFDNEIEKYLKGFLSKLRARSKNIGFDDCFKESQQAFISIFLYDFNPDKIIFNDKNSIMIVNFADIKNTWQSYILKDYYEKSLKEVVNGTERSLAEKYVDAVINVFKKPFNRRFAPFDEQEKHIQPVLSWIRAIITGSLFKELPIFPYDWLKAMVSSVSIEAGIPMSERAYSLFIELSNVFNNCSQNNQDILQGEERISINSDMLLCDQIRGNLRFLTFLKGIDIKDFLRFLTQVENKFAKHVLLAYLNIHREFPKETELVATFFRFFKKELSSGISRQTKKPNFFIPLDNNYKVIEGVINELKLKGPSSSHITLEDEGNTTDMSLVI